MSSAPSDGDKGDITVTSSGTVWTIDAGAVTASKLATGAAVSNIGYTPYNSTNPNGYTSNTGTVTSVSGSGSVSGITLSGTVTSSGILTLGGSLSVASLSTASGSAPSYSARAWVNFNGQGTVSIRASGNVSSITDNGVGDYRLNFTTSMPDANYSWSLAGSSHLNDSTTNAVMVGRTTTSEQTAASLRLDTVRSQGSSMDNQDMALVTVTIFR